MKPFETIGSARSQYTMLTPKNSLSNHSVFALINLYGIWNNVVVANDWIQAYMLSNINTNSTRIFYMFDLDWHKFHLGYKEQLSIIQSMDRIICRCEEHRKQIYDHFGVMADIMPTYSFDELMKNI